MNDEYFDEYAASLSEIRHTLNALNVTDVGVYTSVGKTPIGADLECIDDVWDSIDTEQNGYLATSNLELIIGEYFNQARRIVNSKFDEFENDMTNLLGNGVSASLKSLHERCMNRLTKRGDEFESNPRHYVHTLVQALSLEGQASLLRSEFCDKAPNTLFGFLEESFETENDSKSMSKLVLHLESAERTNLRLREELAHVKQQLKSARETQKHIHTDKLIMSKEYEEVRLTQVGATEDVVRLRNEKAKLLVEKETWKALNENLQRDNTRLVQENTKMIILQDEVSRLQKEVEQWKEQYVNSERSLNELRSERNTLTIENERLLADRNSDSFYTRRSPRNTAPPGITVKTVYQSDVRCWEPQSEDCYRDLIEFVKTQYDSTYIISYSDTDGDLVRIVNDMDCRRAFEVARSCGWDSIKLQVELRAEIEVRKKYTDLELKHRKLKKQLQKLKKRADNPYKSLQGKAGRVVLDQMLQSYHSKFEDDLKDPLLKLQKYTLGHEQASLWSLKDQFARNVKGDLHSGWALIQIEVDNRKIITEALGKKTFLGIRELLSQYLVNYAETIESATFFDLQLCYMILIKNQDEQSIKSVARNVLNVITDQDILGELSINRIPGVDQITCSAGAVMYQGEEDYLRWSRKADEALEYGKAHGPNQVGNWEQYHLKRQGGANKRLPGDPYITSIIQEANNT